VANPMILYENFFETGTLTSSPGDAAGYPKENIRDWRASTAYRWKSNATTKPATITIDYGSAVSPDTACIGGHNLFSANGRWKIQGSTDNFGASIVDMFASATPTSNAPQIATWNAASYRYWRIYLDSAAASFTVAPQLGILTVGRRLDFTLGAMPGLAPYDETAETQWTENEGGALIGANYRFRRKAFSIAYDAPGMADTDFFTKSGVNYRTGFIPHSRSKPFWFAWNYSSSASELYLCRVDGGHNMPFIGSTARSGLNVRFVSQADY